jgi:DNA-binding LacI/PurR family transcriptional regulator
MKVTIEVVAKRAGVSKTTVSRILNGNYEHTTEETKNRILSVIQELDYQPNALAKGLKSARTNVIGIVLSDLKNPYWSAVLEGVEDMCRKFGYNLMICNSDEDPGLEEQYIKEFQMRRVDGIVINPTVKNMELYQKMVEEDFPMVVINRKVPGISTNQVVIDNIKGASLAINHLLNNNRKNIAVFVYQNSNISPWEERVEGYRRTMLQHGYRPEDLKILKIERQSGKVQESILRFMRENPGVDAIFSTNNMLTLEVLKGLKQLHLNVPEHIAIVGYDETVWSEHLNPPLTTVMQPAKEMGKIATKLLNDRIHAKPPYKLETIILEPQLMIRKSCGSSEGGVSIR